MAYTNKHTPGKWVVSKNEFYYEVRQEGKISGGMVVSLHLFDNDLETVSHNEEGTANAKLISAAPELRQCVEMFYDYLNNDKSKNSIAMNVVKKTLIKAGVEFTENSVEDIPVIEPEIVEPQKQ